MNPEARGFRLYRSEPSVSQPEMVKLLTLSETQCLELLRDEAVGRVGLSVNALPVILPVNYVMVDRTIVFASESGLKLDAARRTTVACFQIDGHGTWAHEGWSVLATGRLNEIEAERSATLARELPLTPWAFATPRHYVELSIELLSGRRLIGC